MFELSTRRGISACTATGTEHVGCLITISFLRESRSFKLDRSFVSDHGSVAEIHHGRSALRHNVAIELKPHGCHLVLVKEVPRNVTAAHVPRGN